MTLGRSIAIVVALAVATTAGVAAWLTLSRWGEGPGPRLRRDCTSLVDTVLAEDRTVSRFELEAELARRGVKAPPFPQYPQRADTKEELEKWLHGRGEYGRYEAEKKAYDARWKEIEESPAYQPAWETVFAKKRDEAIRDCIVSRARREGVRIR